MANKRNKRENLLAEAAASSSPSNPNVRRRKAKGCGICRSRRNIVCEHLSKSQYASLKAAKLTTKVPAAGDAREGGDGSGEGGREGGGGESGAVFRFYECEHVYQGTRRVDAEMRPPVLKILKLPMSSCYRGTRKNVAGFCPGCWCLLASDGRRRWGGRDGNGGVGAFPGRW